MMKSAKLYAIYASHWDPYEGFDSLYAIDIDVSVCRQGQMEPKEEEVEVFPLLHLRPPAYPLAMGYASVGPYIYMLGGFLGKSTYSRDVFILDTRSLPCVDGIRKGPQLKNSHLYQPYVHFLRGKLFVILGPFGPGSRNLGAEFLELDTSYMPEPGKEWETIPYPKLYAEDFYPTIFKDGDPTVSFPVHACNVIGSFIVVSLHCDVLYMLDADRPWDGWKRILSSKCILLQGIGANTGLQTVDHLVVTWSPLPMLDPYFIAWDLKRLELHLQKNNGRLDDHAISALCADVRGSKKLAGDEITFGVRRVLDIDGGNGMAVILSFGTKDCDGFGDLRFILDVVQMEKKAPRKRRKKVRLDLALVGSYTYVDPRIGDYGCLRNVFLV